MKKQVIAIVLLVLAVTGVLVAKELTKRNDNQSQTPPAEVTQTPTAPRKDFVRSEHLLTGAEFVDALDNGRPTLAEFGKGTCSLCIKMEPILHETAQTYKDKVDVVSVDVEEYIGLTRKYEIQYLPTQIFFDKQGKIANTHIGYMSGEEIAGELANLGATQ